MSTVVAELTSQLPAIASILQASGTPSLSVGVFDHGRTILTHHLSKNASSEKSNDDTVYYIASLSKLLAICAVAKLVTDGVLDWDAPIRDYLPTFQLREDDIGIKATLRDLASNRTGLANPTFFWGQQHGQGVIDKRDLIKTATLVKAQKTFRSSFIYSNWNFILLHAIVEQATGKSFGEVMQGTILAPLGLSCTTFELPVSTNLAAPYAVRDNGIHSEIPTNTYTSETGLSAMGGGKSTLSEMMTIYSALLSAYAHQTKNRMDTTPGSPFTHLRTIFRPHIAVDQSSPESSQAYCLGIYRTELPGNLSVASLNALLLHKKTPIFGLDLSGIEVYHHTGNLPGYFHSMYLLPGTHSGVVCLSNATPLMDPTDFSAQLLLGALLGSRTLPDYVSLALSARSAQLGWYVQLAKYLQVNRTEKPPSLPLTSYSGAYANSANTLVLEVTAVEEGLHVSVRGRPSTTYHLLPWNGDTFYWEANREREVCEKAMWPIPSPQWHLVTFSVGKQGVETLKWQVDALARGPDTFQRQIEAGRTKL
ncbi:beta-lactamase/transpeptidase-like protein [Karstenula rhodostoma CBS 690.94]|uniref:Beta-lactamase/transpeptidase-like protein n=1 Tax=Karstenula rhodostoma CBS 690.94 TaxID=1392251 RepID=A0A9P4U9H4_9PLEO|nr:beta-lactamase/transpeptidase-like protein [Karstenula rhodostoma CBS 690.94]